MMTAVSRLSAANPGAMIMEMPVAPQVNKALLERAKALTGLQGRAEILNAGLEALIARESARRLIALGGTQKKLRTPRRRRPAQSG
jgi:hypothetical protein